MEHRAEIVLSHFGADKLERLIDVIQQAVRCRNYTHGHGVPDPGDVDYADFKVVLFLTDTLQFIYGDSELLLCGWEPAKSARDELHPLKGYVESYDARSSMVLGPHQQSRHSPDQTDRI